MDPCNCSVVPFDAVFMSVVPVDASEPNVKLLPVITVVPVAPDDASVMELSVSLIVTFLDFNTLPDISNPDKSIPSATARVVAPLFQ